MRRLASDYRPPSGFPVPVWGAINEWIADCDDLEAGLLHFPTVSVVASTKSPPTYPNETILVNGGRRKLSPKGETCVAIDSAL